MIIAHIHCTHGAAVSPPFAPCLARVMVMPITTSRLPDAQRLSGGGGSPTNCCGVPSQCYALRPSHGYGTVIGMGKDETAAERRRRQKERRRAAGWDFVQVWVPSKADGDELRRRAAMMRDEAGSDPAEDE